MSNEVTCKGTLSIRSTKKGQDFLASYTGSNGKAVSNMTIRPQAMFFDKTKAEDGDELDITLVDGQITKCIIVGKEVISPAPVLTQKPQSNNKNFNNRTITPGYHALATPSNTGATAHDNATAPYNFIPYEPKAVVTVEDPTDYGIWSGVLRCRLKALTPLLIAGESTKRNDESSENRFFQINGKNCIPGSSIKGVLRSIVEIVSFSALRQLSDKELFWRIVTGANYREAFTDELLGGYLRRVGTNYELYPVRVKQISHIDRPRNDRHIQTGGIRTKSGRYSCDYEFSALTAENKPIPVDREIVEIFKRQMTENQLRRWNEEKCNKEPGHPVFYRKNSDGNIAELGLCRYFRIKYEVSPKALAGTPQYSDITEHLFGTITKDKNNKVTAIKGRISIEPAAINGNLYRQDGCTAILGTPHPTSLAHYIVQDKKKIKTISRGTQNDPESLVGYRRGEKLRGRKLYWHHDVDESLWFTEDSGPNKIKSQKVITHLYPLAPGVEAEILIHVDRLTDIELGALLEAISYANSGHAWKIGMGKSLGFGSVELNIKQAAIENIRNRYSSLANRTCRSTTPCLSPEKQQELKDNFRKYICGKISDQYAPWSNKKYDSLPPIEALQLMTNFEKRPSPQKVKYMSLNDFKRKALLKDSKGVMQ